jgi:hypothetical protein
VLLKNWIPMGKNENGLFSYTIFKFTENGIKSQTGHKPWNHKDAKIRHWGRHLYTDLS